MSRDVAILCEFGALQGAEYSLLAVLPWLLTHGWRPTVLCPCPSPLAAKMAELGVSVAPFDRRSGGGSLPLQATRTALAERFARLSPAIVHANSLAMGRISGPVAAELRLPSLSHLRDIVSLSRTAMADLNLHTRLLAVSTATRAAHQAQGLDAERTFVLHNGVDVAAFRPGPKTGWLHRALGLPTGTPLVGCIGQIILRKGQDVLARAACRLAMRSLNVHYVFVGQRHSEKDETRRFESALRASFEDGPLAGRGHFLGTRDDIPRLLRELTILVHPARQEPLGRVLLEAGAAGCAIVATDVGGTTEVFPPHTDTALLVPPGDSESLAAAMEHLLTSPERRAKLGNQARQRIEQAFGVEASAAALLRHYNEVAASSRR